MTSHFVYVFFPLRFHIYLTFSLWLRKARNRKKIIISLVVISPANELSVMLKSGWDGSHPGQDRPHPLPSSFTQCGEAHSDRAQSPWQQHISSFRASSLQLFLMLFTYNFYSAVMLYVCSI